jgi:hypothetical protein
MTKGFFAAFILVFGAFATTDFARTHRTSSDSGFAGTWKRTDRAETMTITLNGGNAVLTYSKGSPDAGTVLGSYLSYEGVIKMADGVLLKSTGKIQLTADGGTLIKHQTVYYPTGATKTSDILYTRASSPSEATTSFSVTDTSNDRTGGSAQQFVQSFYNWYVPIATSPRTTGLACEIALDKRPQAFSEKLYRQMKKETTAQGTSRGRLGLGADPFLNSQDPAPRYTVGNASKDGGHQNVEVYAVYDGQRREFALKARVKQQHGQWVFTDFLYGNGGSLKKQLKMEED